MPVSPRLERHQEKPLNRDARVGDVIAVKASVFVGITDHNFYLVTGVPRNEGIIALRLSNLLTEVTAPDVEILTYEKLNELGAGYTRISGHCVAGILSSMLEWGHEKLYKNAMTALLNRAREADLFDKATNYEYLS